MIGSLFYGIQRLIVLGMPATPYGMEGAPATPGEVTQVVNDAVNGAAAAVQEAPAGLFGGGMLPMALIWGAAIIGFWFLLIRPQKKRDKKLKELQSSIKTGDNVVVSGGMFGRVADIGTDCFVIEMGIGGRTVKIPILKADVLSVRDPVLTPPPKVIE